MGALRVHSLRGKEGLSEAWRFDLVASGASGEEAERLALGQRAALIFTMGDKTRAFYGVVASIKLDEVHPIDREVKYVIRVVPRLWLLRRNNKTRIFQGKRVPDIVNAILLESNIVVRWSLTRLYPRREYCTQYEESDYDFIRRILAEAGIYFYFFGGAPVAASDLEVNTATGLAAQIGGAAVGMAVGSAGGGLAGAAIQLAETLIPGDTIVCADDALCYPSVAGDDPAVLATSTVASLSASAADAIGGDSPDVEAVAGATAAVAGAVIAAVASGGVLGLTFMPNANATISAYDKLVRFGLRNSVRPAGGAFRDYDPDKPHVRLQSVAVSTSPFPPSPLEVAVPRADYAPRLLLWEGEGGWVSYGLILESFWSGSLKHGWFNDEERGRPIRDKIRKKLAKGAEFHLYACNTADGSATNTQMMKQMANTFDAWVYGFSSSIYYHPTVAGNAITERRITGVGKDEADAIAHEAMGIMHNDQRTSFAKEFAPTNPAP